MSILAMMVLSTVNAPYGTTLSAEQLAFKISDPESVIHCDPAAFSFYSEVEEGLQNSFIEEMRIDPRIAADVAKRFSAVAGYALPLARAA